MSQRYQALINGHWTAAASGATAPNLNPANTSDEIGTFPCMDEQDAAAAFEAATAALPAWRATTPIARGDLLTRTASLLRARLEEIAHDLTREEGKPLSEACGEVAKAADTLAFYGAFGRRPLGELLPDGRQDVLALTLREPLGVVVAITPWNVPLAIPARKLAPALLAGNTVVLKPASLTPLSAVHLVRALLDAGLPSGVVNLLTGSGSALGQTLAQHPAVRAISFTGSNEIGSTLAHEAALHGVRVQTEMGGKNALVVLNDADLEQAVSITIAGAFASSGQQCTATSRVIVEQGIYEAFLAQLVARVRQLRVGPGLDPDTHMGPLVSSTQLDSVLMAVARAHSQQARIVIGSERLTGGIYDQGYFMAPTVLAEATPTMDCMQEEIFGPVVAVCPVASLKEAISVTNNTRYGLSAAIATRSLGSAHRFIREAEAGAVGVNVPTTGWDVQLPFGGFKDSGSPFKEHATDAIAFFSRTKAVAINPLS